MTQAVLNKKLNKTVSELELLSQKVRRKVLEFEAMMSMSEFKQGKFKKFSSAKALLKSMQ